MKNAKFHVFSILFLVFCTVFCNFFVREKVYAQETLSCFINSNTAGLYTSFDLSSEKICTLSHKDKVTIEADVSGAVEYLSADNFVFFKILSYNNLELKTEGYGFVLADLVSNDISQIESIPNFNAKIISQANVYFKEDNNFVVSSITLDKETKVYLYEGYKRKSEFTAICFEFDNQIVYGFVKTSLLKPDGINPLLITCITLIIAVLTISLSLILIKKKKAK